MTRLEALCGPNDRALIVIAHPDDETFCSGLIALLTGQGSRVTILCVTRGEGGDTGGNVDREGLAVVREAELRTSASALGVDDVRLLGLVDPLPVDGVGQAPAVSHGVLTGLVAGVLDGLSPRLVVTHGSRGEYGHPAHLVVHHAVLDATRERRPMPDVLTVLAEVTEHPLAPLVNVGDRCDLLLDVSAVQARRLAALLAHRTQAEVLASLAGSYGDLHFETYHRVPASDVRAMITRDATPGEPG